jgi:hypothetical protein
MNAQPRLRNKEQLNGASQADWLFATIICAQRQEVQMNTYQVVMTCPPTNRASRSLVKFVFGEEDEHEEALYGTANHRVSEGS